MNKLLVMGILVTANLLGNNLSSTLFEVETQSAPVTLGKQQKAIRMKLV